MPSVQQKMSKRRLIALEIGPTIFSWLFSIVIDLNIFMRQTLLNMRPIRPFHKGIFFPLIILVVASCSPKSKTEQPAESADSTRKSLPKIEAPKANDPVVEKPIDKKETKPLAPPKKSETPAKAEVKIEPPVTPVKEPVKVPVPVKEPVVVTPPAKEPEKVSPPKIDSSSIKKPLEKPKGKPYYFKVVRKENGKEINGSLQLQESAGATQFQVVKSGEIVYLEEPKNRRGAYTIVALLPGYRQSSLVFCYFNPP